MNGLLQLLLLLLLLLLQMSYMELYNENLNDLLRDKAGASTTTKAGPARLDIRETPSGEVRAVRIS